MTVSAGQTPIVIYAYTGPNDYDFSFRVFQSDDIIVSHIDVEGVRNTLTEGEFEDYTVSLLSEEDGAGGTCTLLYTPTDGTLEIRRSMLIEQPTDWVNNNPFNAELLETDLDRAIMIVQEMQTIVSGQFLQGAWRGLWQASTDYALNELVVAANNNWYIAIANHTSTDDFDADLASGDWILIFDVTYLEDLTARAAQSEFNASESAAASIASAAEALQSAIDALASQVAADLSETNSAASAAEALQSAVDAEAAKEAAEAIVAAGERLDAIETYTFTATAGQTVFVLPAANNEDNLLVFINSRKLRLGEDYTCNIPLAATSIVLVSGAAVGDEIDVVSVNTYTISSGVLEIIAGAGIAVDDTSPSAPIVSSTGDGTTDLGISRTAIANSITSSTGTGIALITASSSLAGLLTAAKFDELVAATTALHAESHTVVSHSDTSATGAQLNLLVGGTEISIHSHAVNTALAAAVAANTLAIAVQEAINIDRMEPNGFILSDPDSMGDLSWDDATRTLTHSVHSGQTEFAFYSDGVKFAKTTSQTKQIADTSGMHFLYYDDAGTLQTSAIFADIVILKYAIVFIVYWNAIGQYSIVPSAEWHGIGMSGATHLTNHRAVGALVDKVAGGMLIDGLTDGSANYTQTTSGIFWDEDLKVLVGSQATHRFLYKLGSSGLWYKTAADGVIGHDDGVGGDTYWNEDAGGTWQLTESSNSTDYIPYYFL